MLKNWVAEIIESLMPKQRSTSSTSLISGGGDLAEFSTIVTLVEELASSIIFQEKLNSSNLI